jgi:hypothetical protein
VGKKWGKGENGENASTRFAQKSSIFWWMGIPHPHIFPQPVPLLNAYKKREISFFYACGENGESPHGCEEKGVFVPLAEGI